MTKIRHFRIALRVITAVLICEIVGFIGAFFTVNALTTWYVAIAKPSWNPPTWIFGPVWTLLYTLMGISLYLVWEKARTTREGKEAMVLFGIQLLLNILWSVIFFGLQDPRLSLFEIVLLLASIIATTVLFWRIHKMAGILLIPYIAWVSFATILNFAIWRLNG
jgi:tryptophan-rich sensory protein